MTDNHTTFAAQAGAGPWVDYRDVSGHVGATVL